MKKFTALLYISLYFCFGQLIYAQVDSDKKKKEIDSLNSEILSLTDSLIVKNEKIAELMKKLNYLEQISREQIIKEKENWRKLEKYMSMSEVQKLLGKPTSIDKFNTYTRWWYGNGYVDFNPFKAATIWSEPRKKRLEVIEH